MWWHFSLFVLLPVSSASSVFANDMPRAFCGLHTLPRRMPRTPDTTTPPALRRLPASPLPALHDTFGPRLVRCIATTKKNCPVWLTGRRHPRPFHAHCVSTQPGRPHDRRKYRFFVFKNLDNPAVQLQGPFLQDRLIPPPTHRNVIMIAAGTGVNPSEYAAHMQTVGIGVFEYWP